MPDEVKPRDCNCFKFLDVLHACKLHRKPKPQVFAMTGIPDDGGKIWREISAAAPYGEVGPSWLESEKGWH